VRVRILILGGTGEARALAGELMTAGADVISSLAGRTPSPLLPAGAVRSGGFGGAAGLAAFLRAERITRCVDATHPFATRISAAAAEAAEAAGIPLLVLQRPEWAPGRLWETAADMAGAAAAVRAWPGESVFLATGRRGLAAFAADDGHSFLVRALSPPDGPAPARMTVVLDRGPYTVAGETALMRAHRVGLLVTRNSGGPMAEPKLRAADDLGVRVVAVARPPLPPGSDVAGTVTEAASWALRQAAAG
jgi:precorrin-6A/cobalt-precorrin-6A reductase